MNQRVIVVNADFAGMWAAILTARLVHLKSAAEQIYISAAPEEKLKIYPGCIRLSLKVWILLLLKCIRWRM
ncbi:hypothetical protein ABC733_01155 [Mangrovibacter sp. SLW1]